ncbi:MAG: lipopolysaccharide biosynthesis protein [Sphingosinicella sp.]
MATTSSTIGPAPAGDAFARQVKGAVMWRSGSQIAGQLIAWASTLLVVRMLHPADYGLVAMTGVVLVLLNLFNGWGFGSALVRDQQIDDEKVGQAFGLLLLLNGALAVIQLALAPFAADYFHQPMVAQLLQVQALFYLANPFIALGHALLARRMDFRRQAQVNLSAAVLSALTALTCAFAGMGVWTLVAAPVVLWYAQAIGYLFAARLWLKPVFRFRGAGAMARYGGAMILVQFCWFVQSQADIVIAGHELDAHAIGLYTTALFLTQILAAKFVPPLNEVAFAAYSRIQSERDRVEAAFLKSVRLVLAMALPFYAGLALTAEPLVLTLLGSRWDAIVPLVPILACAMPLMTLQILFSPATNALGRPGLALATGIVGALAMSAAFLVGLRWGIVGLAWGWLAGMAVLLAATILVSLPAIGASRSALVRAVAPGLTASLAMAAALIGFDALLPAALAPAERLALLVPYGIAAYFVALRLLARPLLDEMRALLVGRPLEPQPAVQS